jgi:glycosyltransferase involved in cell wall biosynthesis
MPSVAILLCTLNGARFLGAQLASFANQQNETWRLFVSDDGSTDQTFAILSHYRDRVGSSKVVLGGGPRQGFVRNFLSLACDASISEDYYCYADQDDVWDADKLSRALAWLQTRPPQRPALYCARTRLIDEDDRECGFSPLFVREPSFRNALVQSLAGGNTMVFNDAARQLLLACGSAAEVPAHDWWTYLLVTAAGGEVYYDPIPSVRYRVHPQNVIGSNTGWPNRIRRLRLLAAGQYAYWSDLHIAALEPFRPLMTIENRRLFELFCKARKRGFFGRQIGFLETGIYRQTLLGNLSLLASVWAGKL